jgi:hypothetical protein
MRAKERFALGAGEMQIGNAADFHFRQYPSVEVERHDPLVAPPGLMRRLDTLFDGRLVPPADYIKLDCEGFEPHILRRARRYLKAAKPICVSTETGFNSTLGDLLAILSEYDLRVFDVNVVRAPRPAYATAVAQQPWTEPDPLSEAPRLQVGSPGTLDVVFCQDFCTGAATETSPPDVDSLIKAMINF